MKALVTTGRGPLDLATETVAEPVPRADEALVEVHATSVNRADLLIAARQPVGSQLGLDLVGTVLRPAADGSGPPVGTRVDRHERPPAGVRRHELGHLGLLVDDPVVREAHPHRPCRVHRAVHRPGVHLDRLQVPHLLAQHQPGHMRKPLLPQVGPIEEVVHLLPRSGDVDRVPERQQDLGPGGEGLGGAPQRGELRRAVGIHRPAHPRGGLRRIVQDAEVVQEHDPDTTAGKPLDPPLAAHGGHRRRRDLLAEGDPQPCGVQFTPRGPGTDLTIGERPQPQLLPPRSALQPLDVHGRRKDMGPAVRVRDDPVQGLRVRRDLDAVLGGVYVQLWHGCVPSTVFADTGRAWPRLLQPK